MKIARIGLYILGTMLVFFAMLFFIAAVYEPIRALTGFIFLLIGAFLIFTGWKLIKETPKLSDFESSVISLARRSGGKLTVPQVMADLDMTNDQARAILRKLSTRPDVCSLELAKNGTDEIYVFPAWDKSKKSKT